MELSTIDFNQPIIDLKHPKIMSYIPTYRGDNSYETVITDTRIQKIDKILIKLTLIEIRGNGLVSYKLYYNYHIINNFEIYILNPNDIEPILLSSYSGEDLLSNLNCNPGKKTFLKYNGGKDDHYCKIKEGKYLDDIIFKSRDISIPIETYNNDLTIFPNTTLIFKFKLNSIENIISYNDTFKNNSLNDTIEYFKNSNLNIKIQFINTVYDFSRNIPKTFIIEKKQTIGQNNTRDLNSQEFNNCYGISFRMKTNTFKRNYKFISIPDTKVKEEFFMNHYINCIMQDLVIISKNDLTKNENKIKEGFKKESIFEKIDSNNYIFHDEDKRKMCKIIIDGVPEDHFVWYHKNILTYTRRYIKNNTLNLSMKFNYIKGICLIEDDLKIQYLDIKHDITIDEASIPVDIWNSEKNTSYGDLRRDKSKNTDMNYNNDFILGMDFYSKDKGFNKIIIKAGKDILENYHLETKNLFEKNRLFKITEYDKNIYPHIILFNTFTNENNFIESNKDINFNTFLCSIDWNYYNEWDPKDLYERYPILDIYQVKIIDYDIQNSEIKLCNPVIRSSNK